MSQTGHLENETWVHLGCWLRKGLGELRDVGKLCPEKGENLVYQDGTELPVLQTHPFKAILEAAQSLSQTCYQNYSSTPRHVFWLCPSRQCWLCGHFLPSAPRSTAQFEGEDLRAWTREAPLQNLKHFHIFPVDSFQPFTVSPRGSHLQDLAHRQFFLPPLPRSPNDLAGGDLGQEERLLLCTMKSPAPVWVCRKVIPDTFHL